MADKFVVEHETFGRLEIELAKLNAPDKNECVIWTGAKVTNTVTNYSFAVDITNLNCMHQDIEKKPDYYNGIMDAKIKQAHDEVLLREWKAYNDYLTRVDKVITYADEPPACKERSEQLRTEMEAIRHKSVSVDTLRRQLWAS